MTKKTALFETHQKLKAQIVDFAGWQMPLRYSSIIEEHKAVRNAAGLFDITHMGEILIEGKGALDFVNRITTNDISKTANFGCQYSVCCYPDGGVVDDVISYRFSDEKIMIVVNAANTQKDYDWFVEHAPKDLQVTDVSDRYTQLALQGPLAQKIIMPLVDYPPYRLASFRFCETKIKDVPIILSRTGYTGEDGFEIYCDWQDGPKVWDILFEVGESKGLKPIGLGARDTLRLEAAYSLYGNEISSTINPFEARLMWVVKMDKPDFIGKEALSKIMEVKPKRQLIGLEILDKGIARHGHKVFYQDQEIGEITSGSFSPTLDKAVALALIDKEKAGYENFTIEVRNQKLKASKHALPFYKKGS